MQTNQKQSENKGLASFGGSFGTGLAMESLGDGGVCGSGGSADDGVPFCVGGGLDRALTLFCCPETGQLLAVALSVTERRLRERAVALLSRAARDEREPIKRSFDCARLWGYAEVWSFARELRWLEQMETAPAGTPVMMACEEVA